MLTGGSLIVSAEHFIMEHLTLEVIRTLIWPTYIRKKVYFECTLPPKVSNRRHLLMLSISHTSSMQKICFTHLVSLYLMWFFYHPLNLQSRYYIVTWKSQDLSDSFGSWFIPIVRRKGLKIDDLERSMIDSLKVTL